MVAVTIHLGLPALAGITRQLEHKAEIRKFFHGNGTQHTLRFRQFVGVAVRLAMEQLDCRTTKRKAYLSTFSKFFTPAKIFAPPLGHPDREIWESGQGEIRVDGEAA